jgi:hypothetical protein
MPNRTRQDHFGVHKSTKEFSIYQVKNAMHDFLGGNKANVWLGNKPRTLGLSKRMNFDWISTDLELYVTVYHILTRIGIQI